MKKKRKKKKKWKTKKRKMRKKKKKKKKKKKRKKKKEHALWLRQHLYIAEKHSALCPALNDDTAINKELQGTVMH